MNKEAKTQMERLRRRSERMLKVMGTDIDKQKEELGVFGYYRKYSKGELTSELGISKAIAESTLKQMKESGIELSRDETKATRPYQLDLSDIERFYTFRGVEQYRDRYKKALILFVTNLKGGVSKTVLSVSLAHGLRTHPRLLKENLRILVIDMDPQASATMFLSHDYSYGQIDNTAVQAILSNTSREEILNNYIVPTQVPGVDLMPASIDDGFLVDIWDELCQEHLPDIKPNEALRKSLLDKIESDYDLILLDTGPHLDSNLKQCLVASDVLITPVAPAPVDFHSTLKYLSRLPDIVKNIEKSGSKVSYKTNIAIMTKLSHKRDQQIARGHAQEVFGGDMLSEVFPRLDALERAGETFDTVITIPPNLYDGDKKALKKARDAVWSMSKALFERIEFLRSDSQEAAA